ncbi:MAG: 16S rRNA (adenine(1518)-N(6)/adenine(1519)-N(6))-dimethyltransferase RsmA [Methanoregulaceae archaeon]|nr:16S rRNA (adenine(1518)-N(6)/adenine(1519)-N(6))-dimethyltransferase RsmA [Methanoregulaceae archaeon]
MRAPKDQHFLTDKNAVRRIAGLIELKDRLVLEIGPGEGILTRELLDRGARVNAVEIDPGLVEELTLFFADEIESGRLAIVHGDAVRCDLPPFDAVVSNLPYSASSKITFRLLAIGFEVAVLMYQAEFARRMVAPAGTPECGRLSIMVQTYCCVERCFDLPPQAFSPKPQVRSTVVKIIPRGPLFPIMDEALYADVVRALFAYRRKTVRNCIRNSAGILDPGIAEKMLTALPEEILVSRPESLYLEDFATISNVASE